MERPVLVAVVVRSDGRRIAHPVHTGSRLPVGLERLVAFVQKLFGIR